MADATLGDLLGKSDCEPCGSTMEGGGHMRRVRGGFIGGALDGKKKMMVAAAVIILLALAYYVYTTKNKSPPPPGDKSGGDKFRSWTRQLGIKV